MTSFISFQAKTTIRFAWSLQAVVIGCCQTVCLAIFGDISRLGSCCFDHKVVHIKHLQIWNICSVDRIKKKNIITDLKFVDIAGSTLLYVFFYFGMHVYDVSVDGVTHLKMLKSELLFQAFKTENQVVVLNREIYFKKRGIVFKTDDPFSTDVTEHFDFQPIIHDVICEIHDQYILIISIEKEFYIGNLNETFTFNTVPLREIQYMAFAKTQKQIRNGILSVYFKI